MYVQKEWRAGYASRLRDGTKLSLATHPHPAWEFREGTAVFTVFTAPVIPSVTHPGIEAVPPGTHKVVSAASLIIHTVLSILGASDDIGNYWLTPTTGSGLELVTPRLFVELATPSVWKPLALGLQQAKTNR